MFSAVQSRFEEKWVQRALHNKNLKIVTAKFSGYFVFSTWLYTTWN